MPPLLNKEGGSYEMHTSPSPRLLSVGSYSELFSDQSCWDMLYLGANFPEVSSDCCQLWLWHAEGWGKHLSPSGSRYQVSRCRRASQRRCMAVQTHRQEQKWAEGLPAPSWSGHGAWWGCDTWEEAGWSSDPSEFKPLAPHKMPFFPQLKTLWTALGVFLDLWNPRISPGGRDPQRS